MPQQMSSVAVGRAYELLVLAVLRRYSFQLVHSGRPGDGGIDFIGHWSLPNTRVNIVGQCKRRRLPLGPRDVREFESAVQRLSRPVRTVTGVLVSYSGFSRQAIRTALNSDLPLIFSEIRTLPSENDPITLFNSDIATPDSQSSSFSNTKVDWQLEGSSKGTGTDMNTVSERKSPKKSDSKLIDRGLPLSQLGFTLWGSEGTKVKCLRKRGYFTRSLPLELSSGYIGDFVMNSTMRSLYPSIRIVWQCGVGKEGGGKGRGILVLFRCPVSGSVYDLGAVSRRHLGSGEPTAWHCRDSGL